MKTKESLTKDNSSQNCLLQDQNKSHNKYSAETKVLQTKQKRFCNHLQNHFSKLNSHNFHFLQSISRHSYPFNSTGGIVHRSNKPKRDGIRAWIQLCNNQDNDGNVDVKKQRYESQTRKPYSKGHKGGLIAYLDEVAEGFAGLEEHGCVYTEEQKMTTLLSNLHLEPHDAYLLTYCRDTFTSFEACYQYLRKEATR